jgi:hypothetical protein
MRTDRVLYVSEAKWKGSSVASIVIRSPNFLQISDQRKKKFREEESLDLCFRASARVLFLIEVKGLHCRECAYGT